MKPYPTTPEEAYPSRWIALAVLLLAFFMNLVDVSIVNVALPSMSRSMGATSSEIEWVAAAYVLAFALGLLPFGRLGDRFGRKAMFLIGVSGFTIFSVLCGLAPDMGSLIGARVLQGIAASMMVPQVMAIAQAMFPPQERGLAFSLFGMSAGLASVAGPLLGGLLIEANVFGLDWRPIFLVNIPVGLIAVIAAWFIVPRTEANPEITMDWGGIVLAALSVFLLVFPLVEGHGYGWPLWIFAMLAASAVGFGALYFFERARDRAGKTELLPTALLHNGNFLLGSFMTVIFFSGVSGFFLVLAVFLQGGFGFTALESGLTTTPFPVGVLIASVLSGRVGMRWQRERIVIGSLALVIGMGSLAWVLSGVGDTVNHWNLAPSLILCGFGLGVGISPLFQTVLATVPPRDAGSGSGALQSFQQIGSAVGIAITGQIFFSSLTARFAEGSMPHPAFVDSLESALIYEVLAFLAVAVLVVFLKRPAAGQSGYGQAQSAQEPVPVEI